MKKLCLSSIAFLSFIGMAHANRYIVFTATANINCGGFANGGKLTTVGKDIFCADDTGTGGGATGVLGVYQNSLQISSPTVQLNFLSPPFLVTNPAGSTATVTLNGSSVTLQGNTFNAANKLLQLNSSSFVPGSLLDPSSVTKLGPFVSLSSGVKDNISTTSFNSGSGATSSTFWRGDGIWATPNGINYPIYPATSTILSPQGLNAFGGTVSAGVFRLFDSDLSNYVGFVSSINVPSNITWTLPVSSGGAGQVLTVDGQNNLYFSTPSVPGLLSISSAAVSYLGISSASLAVSAGSIRVVHPNGTMTIFNPATDSDADRGFALRAATATAVNGDNFYLSASTYDIGNFPIDMNLGTNAAYTVQGTGHYNLHGAGKYQTIIIGTVGTTLVHVGPNSEISDLSIYDTNGSFGIPLGTDVSLDVHFNFPHVQINNVYTNAHSDGVYVYADRFDWVVHDLTCNSNWDCVNVLSGQDQSSFSIYDSSLTCTYDASYGATTLRGIVSNDGVVNSFNSIITSSGSSISNYGIEGAYQGSGGHSIVNISGGQIQTSGTNAYDIKNFNTSTPGFGIVRVMPDVIFNVAKTSGTITYQDTALHSITWADGTVQTSSPTSSGGGSGGYNLEPATITIQAMKGLRLSADLSSSTTLSVNTTNYLIQIGSNNANITYTLPESTTTKGQTFLFEKNASFSTNTVTVRVSTSGSANNINGKTTYNFNGPYSLLGLISDGAGTWLVTNTNSEAYISSAAYFNSASENGDFIKYLRSSGILQVLGSDNIQIVGRGGNGVDISAPNGSVGVNTHGEVSFALDGINGDIAIIPFGTSYFNTDLAISSITTNKITFGDATVQTTAFTGGGGSQIYPATASPTFPLGMTVRSTISAEGVYFSTMIAGDNATYDGSIYFPFGGMLLSGTGGLQFGNSIQFTSSGLQFMSGTSAGIDLSLASTITGGRITLGSQGMNGKGQINTTGNITTSRTVTSSTASFINLVVSTGGATFFSSTTFTSSMTLSGGQLVYNQAPGSAQALIYISSNSRWEPGKNYNGESSFSVAASSISISSPTAVMNFDSSQFSIGSGGASTTQVKLNLSSVTLQGNSLGSAGNVIYNSSGTSLTGYPNLNVTGSTVSFTNITTVTFGAGTLLNVLSTMTAAYVSASSATATVISVSSVNLIGFQPPDIVSCTGLSGGNLVPSTYYYSIQPITQSGVAGPFSAEVAAGANGTINKYSVAWSGGTPAFAYRVHRGTVTGTYTATYEVKASPYEDGVVLNSTSPSTIPLYTSSITVAISSNSAARVGGKIFDIFVDSGNNSTTETDIFRNRIASNTFINNGDQVIFRYVATALNSGTATTDMRVYIGTTSIFDSSALAMTSAASIDIQGTLIRTTSSTARVIVGFRSSGLALATSASYSIVGGINFNADNTLKLTAQRGGVGAATNDIVGKFATGSWFPSASQ